MKPVLSVCITLAAIGMLAAPLTADRVTTFSGKTYVGTITHEDKEKVVIKTDGGTVEVPRQTVRSIEKAKAVVRKPPPIVPKKIDPKDADKAFKEAREAVGRGTWREAAETLEGLMLLDKKAFPAKKRLAATGALVTCYLQLDHAPGAAKSFARRAALTRDKKERQQLQAAAEALRDAGRLKILGKPVRSYQAVVQAAMPWKAQQILAEARKIAAKARGLNRMDRLEKAALACQDRLREADFFVPGFSQNHRKEPIADLLNRIMQTAREAVSTCTQERKELARTRLVSVASRKLAMTWNQKAGKYLARRQTAEEALKNLTPFAEKFEVPGLYDERECKDLLAQLDDLQYYPRETRLSPYERYPPGGRLKIRLRKFSLR